MTDKLPKIKILATGGTIAGKADSAVQMTGYESGAFAIKDLLAVVPQLNDVANISGEEIAKIDSSNITSDIWLKLAKHCNELLNGDTDGVVITHGTDTMEETAYFLNLTVKSNKPVVLVGAMRPATAMSADGPLNLLNAVKVAANGAAAGKGVLVVMNDEIYGARDVIKTHTANAATFKAPDFGALGCVTAGKVRFYKTSLRKHTADSEFNVDGLNALPRVDIVYAHCDADGVFAEAAVKAGAKGIVYAGSGMGGVHINAEPALIEARKRGVAVVRSSRTHGGIVDSGIERWTRAGFLNGDNLNPQKARVLLQLALTKTSDTKKIQRIFEEY